MSITQYVRSKMEEFKTNRETAQNEKEEQKYYSNIEKDSQLERRKAYLKEEKQRLEQQKEYYDTENKIKQLKKQVATEQFSRTTLGSFLGAAQTGIKKIQAAPKIHYSKKTKRISRSTNPFSIDSSITNSMFGINSTQKPKKGRPARGGGWSLPF